MISLTRRPDALLTEASYPGLDRLVPKAVDVLVQAELRSQGPPAGRPPAAAPAAPPRRP